MPDLAAKFQQRTNFLTEVSRLPADAHMVVGGIAMRYHEVPTQYRQYQVRLLRSDDLVQIAELEQRVFPEPMSLRDLTRKYHQPGTRFLVVMDGPRIVAYFGFEVFLPYAHVLANVTHPDYRRQGLAAFVLSAAVPWARELGAKAFLGEVRVSNTAQQAVLAGIGWKSVAYIPQGFGNGEDAHIVMNVFD